MMLLIYRVLPPLLFLLIKEISGTPTDEQEKAARALITPAAQLPKRQNFGPETCGFVDGDFRTPYVCPSEHTCSSSPDPGSTSRFACCNDQSCINDYRGCYSETTNSLYSCSYASTKCLYCTGISSQCAFYSLFGTSQYGAYDSSYAISVSCTDGPSASRVTVRATATNGPLQTVTCIPSGFAYPTPSTTKCASPAVLLIPLIISNVMVLAANILMSSLRFQRKLKFWSKSMDADDPWTVWSGLSTVVLAVVQAIASAALIRAGGYRADWINLILLWLMRPRMLWAVMFLYSIFGKQYKRSGTDALFADGILNVLSIPIAAWFLEAYESNAALCGDNFYFGSSSRQVLDFGQGDYLGLFNLAPLIYLPFAAVDLFIFVAFLWKRRLGRAWAAGAGFWSMAVFALSWFFWVNWVLYSHDSFCVSNVAALAAIHGIFPIISTAFRAWLI